MFKLEKNSIEYENKSLRLPIDMIREVQKLADENNMSFNKVIIQCVRYALQNMNETNEQE